MKKFLFFVLFFYILILIQSSFLSHFCFGGGFLNLILIALILLNFFEDPRKKSCFLVAAIGGFYLDVFSNFYIGSSIVVLILMIFLAKKILNLLHKRNIINFVLVFLVVFVGYNFGVYFLNSLLVFSFSTLFLKRVGLWSVICNLIFGLLVFFFFKYVLEKIRKT
ncbi:hypothetical protein J7K24_00860 [bacterium]|nr:hypothetical protein [bacterium]